MNLRLLLLFFGPAKGNTRKVKLDENFYPEYKRTILGPSEVLINILIPFTQEVINHYIAFRYLFVCLFVVVFCRVS